MQDCPKILVIIPNWIGDVVGSQSLLIALKQKNPNCTIDIAGSKAWVELAKFMPEVNDTFILNLKHGKVDFKARLKEAKELKQRKYDQCIILPNSLKSAILPFLARIRKRTGWLGEQRYILLNDYRKLDKSKYPLMIDRYSALAYSKNEITLKAPLPNLIVPQKYSDNIINKYNIKTDKKIISLCPGAAYGPSKQWPFEYYVKVAKYFIDKGYYIFLLGSPSDKEISHKIEANVNHNNLFNYTGTTSIPEAISIINLSTHVLSNDSGLANMACALKLETTILYGSTAGSIVAPPISDNATKMYIPKLDCQPCKKRVCPLDYFKCMMDLKPKKVISQIESKL